MPSAEAGTERRRQVGTLQRPGPRRRREPPAPARGRPVCSRRGAGAEAGAGAGQAVDPRLGGVFLAGTRWQDASWGVRGWPSGA